MAAVPQGTPCGNGAKEAPFIWSWRFHQGLARSTGLGPCCDGDSAQLALRLLRGAPLLEALASDLRVCVRRDFLRIAIALCPLGACGRPPPAKREDVFVFGIGSAHVRWCYLLHGVVQWPWCVCVCTILQVVASFSAEASGSCAPQSLYVGSFPVSAGSSLQGLEGVGVWGRRTMEASHRRSAPLSAGAAGAPCRRWRRALRRQPLAVAASTARGGGGRRRRRRRRRSPFAGRRRGLRRGQLGRMHDHRFQRDCGIVGLSGVERRRVWPHGVGAWAKSGVCAVAFEAYLFSCPTFLRAVRASKTQCVVAVAARRRRSILVEARSGPRLRQAKLVRALAPHVSALVLSPGCPHGRCV